MKCRAAKLCDMGVCRSPGRRLVAENVRQASSRCLRLRWSAGEAQGVQARWIGRYGSRFGNL